MAVRETPLRPALETAVGDPILVGAGNIASCTSGGDEITAALLDGIPGTVFTAGDNVYEKGTTEEFLNCYAPSWGRHRARTRPVPGDHDHGTAGAAPYFTYFDTLAGPSGRGYYSYDVGSWHVIALDSSIPSGPSSAQYRWLQADLKAHLTACSIAIWHHPLFSSGLTGNSTTMKAIWKALDDAGVDLVVNGHDHNYERFAPQNFNGVANSDGMRGFIVGTGGESLRSFGVIRPNSEVRYNGSVGVLKLTLHPRSYAWEFVTDPAATFTDTGTAACVQMPANEPPVASAGDPYVGDEGGTGIVFDGSGSSDPENGALTYGWDFGDGSTGQGVTSRHAYADNGSYTVTLIVTDPEGLADTTATTATIANVAPMATFSAPATVPVDTAYDLSLSDPADVSSTDFLAGFSYTLDCGTGYGEWSAVSSTTCPGVSVAGPRTVKGQIRDKDLGASEYTATIEIEAPDPDPNAPPVASAGGPYAGDEGGTGIVFDGSGSSDPENEVLTYAWDFGDGSTGQGVTPRHAYADNGSYAVTLVVTDPGGLADTATATATIANVAPMATFDAPATVPADSAYNLSLNDPADVSSTDFLAGFSYALDCGTSYGEWSAVSSTTCPGVSVAGPRTVKGQIRDKDLGTSEYTATIEIEAPDPDPVPPPARADSFPVPIMDGDGLYRGGSNTPPQQHIDAGLYAASQVPESDAVMISLGMSITKSLFVGWNENPQTDAVLVNGACGGCVTYEWLEFSRKGWENALYQLSRKNLTGADVDVIWMSVTQDRTRPATVEELETILLRIREAYPHARQVFVSNRTYGGYYLGKGTKPGGEPGAWGDGPAVRQFVLNHLGETAPWIGWGGDLWANGTEPRSDGLVWNREDFGDDGLHYSLSGRSKVGALARSQFQASPFTGWYHP